MNMFSDEVLLTMFVIGLIGVLVDIFVGSKALGIASFILVLIAAGIFESKEDKE